jgi:tRNA pseudouridine55 synthase
MARRRKGREVSGWLCLDKAIGQTSTQAVSAVKRLFEAAKVGHAGTLDPLASGILPIALGEATKTVTHVQDGRKVYRFTVRWGAETDTDDSDGTVVSTTDQRPDAALTPFTGEIMQRPPVYSAIKIGGERAYDLAREGETVELEERPVTIHRLARVATPDADHTIFEAECGKGTYVRSLARDIGRALGCLGHVTALRRMVVGPFDEAGSVTLAALAEIREANGLAGLDATLKPIGFALCDLPEIVVGKSDAMQIRRGQAVLLRGRDAPTAGGPVHATLAGVSLAVGDIEQGAFHPKRVFRA